MMTEGQSGSELESYAARTDAMAANDSKATRAEIISHPNQS